MAAVNFVGRGIGRGAALAMFILNTGTFAVPKISLPSAATAGTAAAVNVNTTNYGSQAMAATDGTRIAFLVVGASGAGIGTTTAHTFDLIANNLRKWRVDADAAGTCTFRAVETTARYVGGTVNGHAFRNSGNTRDNLQIADAGDFAFLNSGSYSSYWRVRSSSGEATAGAWLTAGSGVWLLPENSTAGVKTGIGYWDLSVYADYRSAVEVASAAGFGTLALMKSGGSVVIGTDPGGTNIFRVGGSGYFANALSIGAANAFSWVGRSRLQSSADGQLDARNNADTAYSFIRGKLQTDNAYTAGAPPAATGYVTIYDSTGTAYRVGVVV